MHTNAAPISQSKLTRLSHDIVDSRRGATDAGIGLHAERHGDVAMQAKKTSNFIVPRRQAADFAKRLCDDLAVDPRCGESKYRFRSLCWKSYRNEMEIFVSR